MIGQFVDGDGRVVLRFTTNAPLIIVPDGFKPNDLQVVPEPPVEPEEPKEVDRPDDSNTGQVVSP